MKHEKTEEIMRAVAQLTGLSRVDHRALYTSTHMALDPPAHSALWADSKSGCLWPCPRPPYER
jgi:hypothetical protein